MSACERCWGAAYLRARTRGGFTVDHYRDLLAEAEAAGVTHDPHPTAVRHAPARTNTEPKEF